mmetsp:Transcript_30128/g.35043  ORF Transcript_30128/g.35043 Transcript_30128/m.35043 type:complete len:623 (-) Transcript_30128:92-1960(-)
MSRRRGEFEHRTSIFEGAYRAWSHLGGCDPIVLATKSPMDQDPLTNPHVAEKDPRCSQPGALQEFPYEPLPRSGLAHPFVQAIVTPWLGPDADQDDISQGLTTLRTWWQHRRKGESTSAKTTLGTPKMNGVVDGYTRHFFNLSHCMVVNDNHQPPRTLCGKLKIKERNNIKSGKHVRENIALKVAQRAISKSEQGSAVHRVSALSVADSNTNSQQHKNTFINDFCSNDPIVHVSSSGDITIAMDVTGISCNHCIKIIETLLTGPHYGIKAPIDGIIDAVAGFNESAILIKINAITSAKRISGEVTELLEMVGYVAKSKDINVDDIREKIATSGFDKEHVFVKYITELNVIFQTLAKVDAAEDFSFYWGKPCTCPADNEVSFSKCSRHAQLNEGIFEVIKKRGELVSSVLSERKTLKVLMENDTDMAPTSTNTFALSEPPLKQARFGSSAHDDGDQSSGKGNIFKNLTDNITMTPQHQANTTAVLSSIPQVSVGTASATNTTYPPASVAASGAWQQGQPPVHWHHGQQQFVQSYNLNTQAAGMPPNYCYQAPVGVGSYPSTYFSHISGQVAPGYPMVVMMAGNQQNLTGAPSAGENKGIMQVDDNQVVNHRVVEQNHSKSHTG